MAIGYGPSFRVNFAYIIIILTSIIFHRTALIRGLLVTWSVLLYWLGELYNESYSPLLALNFTQFDKHIIFLCTVTVVILLNDIYIRTRERQEAALKETLLSLEKNITKLKIANEELERFAYIASHDLKTPIRTIVSYLDLIDKKIRKEEYENLHEYIDFAKSGGKQMNKLVSEILEYSTFNFTESFEIEKIDLNELAKDNVARLQIIIGEKNAEILIQDLPTINANRLFTGLLFQNLIENAIKYNENKVPQVFIHAELEKDNVNIIFEDNGIGIESKFHDKIFDLFTRLHANHVYTGTGIGLAICKKIVDRMNGTINVESNIGKGSRFIISFPN